MLLNAKIIKEIKGVSFADALRRTASVREHRGFDSMTESTEAAIRRFDEFYQGNR